MTKKRGTCWITITHPNGCYLHFEKLLNSATPSILRKRLVEVGIDGQVTEEALEKAHRTRHITTTSIISHVLGWIDGGLEAAIAFVMEWGEIFAEQNRIMHLYGEIQDAGALSPREAGALWQEIEDDCEQVYRILLAEVWPQN